MSALFCIGLLLVMAVTVIAFTRRYVAARAAWQVTSVLLGWTIYVGTLSYLGVTRSTPKGPPGALLIAMPVVVFVTVFVRRRSRNALLVAAPPAIFVAAQTFRVGVELLLHELAKESVI